MQTRLSLSDQTKPGVADIILFGTGGGYGEAILIHFGNGDWVAVDSCINPNTGISIPLEYLKENNVKESDLKLIICTHWHDDHIKGLSQLLNFGVNSEFSCSKANDFEKFCYAIKIDSQRPSSRSTKEFEKCHNILLKRGESPVMSYPDRVLYQNDKDSIISLSPSDESLNEFDQYLSQILVDLKGLNKDIDAQNPNHYSTALQVKLESHTAILGADLETTNNRKTAWTAILDNSKTLVKDPSPKYFKISHHGSKTGYSNEFWDLIFDNELNGTMTPWTLGGNSLPKDDMISLFKGKTRNLFITSDYVVGRKPKKRDRIADRTIKEFNNTISEIKFNFGMVKSSIIKSNEGSKWETKLHGSAKSLK